MLKLSLTLLCKTLNINRDLLIITGGRLLTAVIGLFAIRAMTTFLPPVEYGQLSLLVVVQSFCGLFLVNPVGQHINRHTHEWWESGTLFSRLYDFKFYILVVSIVGGFATLFVANNLSTLTMTLIILAMILMINANTWNSTYVPLLNMTGRRTSAVVWALITSILTLLTSILLCAFWPSAITWFIGQAIGFGVGAIGARFSLKSGGMPRQNILPKRLLNKKIVITYCLPLAIGTGFMWLQLSGYRLIIEHYWGLSLLGFLAVGLTLTTQIWGLTETLAQQFLYPLFYKRVATADKSQESAETLSLVLSDLLNVMMPTYIVLIGITFISAPYLVKLLVAPQYSEVVFYVRLGILIEFFRVIANLLSNAAQITKRPKSTILPYALGALVAVILLIVAGAYRLSLTWAASSLSIAALFMLSTMWMMMRKELQFRLNLTACALAVLIMCAFIVASYMLPLPTEVLPAVFILLCIGLIGVLVLTLLLRSNIALQRLMAVKLRERNIAT